MNFEEKIISEEQRIVALQRLTALWAFCESGLGGILHALHMPFTGLVIGGMAIVLICIIARISENNLRQILKSAIIVLIVKAIVSPHTPFTAYIAVSFQAVTGYILFSLFRVNMVTVFLLSCIAMLESAIQKLLVLTLFFGQSFWKATDSLFEFIVKQFGITSHDGSRFIIAVYLFIYISGGVLVALFTSKTLKGIFAKDGAVSYAFPETETDNLIKPKTSKKKKLFKKIGFVIVVLAILSLVLYVFADDNKQGRLLVLWTITRTLSVLVLWYVLIGPLVTNFIKKYLLKKQSKYGDEVFRTLSFLPALRQLAELARQQSKQYKGPARWDYFFSAFIYWSLTYTEEKPGENQSKPIA